VVDFLLDHLVDSNNRMMQLMDVRHETVGTEDIQIQGERKVAVGNKEGARANLVVVEHWKAMNSILVVQDMEGVDIQVGMNMAVAFLVRKSKTQWWLQCIQKGGVPLLPQREDLYKMIRAPAYGKVCLHN
jgi:hypothetical protein